MMIRHAFLICSACWLSACAHASQAIPTGTTMLGQKYALGRMLVGFKSGVYPQLRRGSAMFGGQVDRSLVGGRAVVVLLPTSVNLSTMLTVAASDPRVLYAEPDWIVKGHETPNDPLFDFQWNLKKVACEWAWDVKKSSLAIEIAILDSGVNVSHPDLMGQVMAGGHDYVNNDSIPNDDNGHGTMVAGIACAGSNNSDGIAGAAWRCSFLPMKVLNASLDGLVSNVVAAIDDSVAAGVHIINMSLGTTSFSYTLQTSVNNAHSAGVMCIASAGNDGSYQPVYPAAFTNCMGVASTSYTDTLNSDSNYGNWVSIAAPGSWIYSTVNNTYGYGSGTSFAAPLVAGIAAIMYQKYVASKGTAAADSIRQLLESTAVDLGLPIAGGRLDAHSAVRANETVVATWTATYDSGYGDDEAFDVVCDSSGNSYVIGSTPGSSGVGTDNNDFITLKYSEAGALIWSTTLNEANRNDIGQKVVLDPSGALYVAGSTENFTGFVDAGITIAKIDRSTGAEVWRRRIPAGANGTSHVDALMFDPAGYVTVVGSLRQGTGAADIVVAKYDLAGTQSWQKSIDLGQRESASDAKLDPAGNTYVVGTTGGAAPDTNDWVVRRLDPAGNTSWTKTVAGQAGQEDGGRSIAVDSYGNSFVVGETTDTFNGLDRTTIAYNSAGTFLWEDDYNSPGQYDVATPSFAGVDQNGDLITMGRSGAASPAPLNFTKFDGPSGNLDWLSELAGSYSGVGDATLDADGTIFACMNFGAALGAVKFDNAGVFRWAAAYAAGGNTVLGNALANGPNDETTIVGRQRNNTTMDKDLLVVRVQVAEGGGTTTGTLGGHIDLDQYAGTDPLIGVIEFRNPGATTALVTIPLTVDAAGFFAPLTVPQGVYDVAVYFEGWLKKVEHTVVVASTPVDFTTSLICGDVDVNNSIDLGDINVVFLNFSTSGPDGDANRDSSVDLGDLNIEFISFAIHGDT